ncbi:MAG TPA: DUF4019 domain-containing protein [Myxococcaceae bacterium]|nr:DUF4019 domain-containing protein [Myxococcaceae bacterium]
MIRSIARASPLVVLVIASAVAAGEPSDAAGVQAAEAWLKLVDAGQYGASWDEAAPMFRERVSRAEWEKMAAAARRPLGKVLSRKLSAKQVAHTLPGAPDGTYVVLVYETRFEHKEKGSENVTVMLDPQGRFRAAGYFIR